MIPPARFCGHDLLLFRGEQPIFARLSFELAPGGALTLVGPNGSGKSSLLRLMAGLLEASSGALRWGETIIRPGEEHGARLAYLGHLDAIKPSLTVAEHLAFHAGGAVSAGALDALDLRHLAETPGRLLSAGQRRRVALTRLLIRPAPLWLLDEPTNGLDRASVERFRVLAACHRAAGGMIVASTHVDLGLSDAQTLDLGDFPPILYDDEDELAAGRASAPIIAVIGLALALIGMALPAVAAPDPASPPADSAPHAAPEKHSLPKPPPLAQTPSTKSKPAPTSVDTKSLGQTLLNEILPGQTLATKPAATAPTPPETRPLTRPQRRAFSPHTLPAAQALPPRKTPQLVPMKPISGGTTIAPIAPIGSTR